MSQGSISLLDSRKEEGPKKVSRNNGKVIMFFRSFHWIAQGKISCFSEGFPMRASAFHRLNSNWVVLDSGKTLPPILKSWITKVRRQVCFLLLNAPFCFLLCKWMAVYHFYENWRTVFQGHRCGRESKPLPVLDRVVRACCGSVCRVHRDSQHVQVVFTMYGSPLSCQSKQFCFKWPDIVNGTRDCLKGLDVV